MSNTIADRRSKRVEDYTAAEFIGAYENAENDLQRSDVRTKMKRLDGGRWYAALKASYNHYIRGDGVSQARTAAIHSDEYMEWIAAYGVVEDLNPLSEYSGVER